MPKYKVTSGKHEHTDGTILRPGDVVELKAEEAKKFGDRFEKVEEPAVEKEDSGKKVASTSTPAPAPAPAPTPAPKG